MRYENKGYPFVKIFVENVSVYEDSGKFKLSVNLNIFEEKTVQINQIKIKGNELTNDNVITREIKLGKDKTISTDILQNIKTRLERLNIFEKVEDPKIYKPKNSNLANLLIEVKEGNPNNFDGILGYVPPATDNDNGYFTGLVKLSFKNIFGTARKIDARWQQEVKSTQELEFKYTEPYLLGYPVYGNLGFLQRIQDTTYTRRKIDLKCDVLFSDKFIVSLSSGFDRIIPSTDSTRIFKIADSRILYGAAELRYDNRDNIFIPGSGGEYKIYYSYGNKRIYNISEFQNLGYSEFFSVQKYSAEIEFYLSPFKRITNLIKGFIGEVKSDKLEDADFFRIGGIKNIRGYREEQFLASDLFYSNLELRYSVSRKSFLFGFYDFGYYSKPEDNLNHISSQKAFLFGYGLGIRLETPLGLVSISYALGKGDGILDGKIHFGYINDF
jgi:outer membrane protein insertion porin family